MKHRVMTALCLIALAAGLTPALRAAPITGPTLNELMDLSGLDARLAVYPATIGAGLVDGIERSRARRPAPAAAYAAALAMVDESMLGRDLRPPVFRALRARLSEEDALRLLIWLRSDLGMRITAAALAADTPAARRDMQRRGEALLLSEQRVAMAREMNAILGVTELVLAMQEQSFRAAIRSGVGAGMNDHDQQELALEFARSLASRRAAVEQVNLISLVHAYRGVSIGDLRLYLELLRTDASRRFHAITGEEVLGATEAALIDFVERLAQVLGAGQGP